MKVALALSVTVFVSLLASAPQAWADVPPPPEETICQENGLDAGERCTIASSARCTPGPCTGACTPGTCTERVFLPDGGRDTRSVSCLLCLAADAGSSDDDGGTPADTDGGNGASGGAGGSGGGSSPVAACTAKDCDAKAPEASGCSAAAVTSARFAPFGLALVVPFAFAVTRRLRRR